MQKAMKGPLVFAVCGALMVAGCGQDSGQASKSTNAAASGSSPLTAPVDYLGAVAKGQQNAVKTVDTARLNQAVQLFNVDQGRNPKNLDELVAQKYIPQIPAVPYGMKLDYDPTSGKVTVVKQ
jgi:hypothetical protein